MARRVRRTRRDPHEVYVVAIAHGARPPSEAVFTILHDRLTHWRLGDTHWFEIRQGTPPTDLTGDHAARDEVAEGVLELAEVDVLRTLGHGVSVGTTRARVKRAVTPVAGR